MAVMLDSIDIYDPDGYVDAPPHAVFEYLRREQPVYWQDMPDGTGYWAILKHADVVEVSRQPTLFSAEIGSVVLEDLPPERLEQTKNMLLMMDPPKHVSLRRETAPSFKARVMAQLEDRIRAICRAILVKGADMEYVEFVHDLAALLPSQVVGELLALPEDDWPQIHEWAERNSGGQDPDINPDGYIDTTSNDGSIAMAMYGMEYARTRRGKGGDDVGAMLLAAEVDGRPMTDLEFGFFFVQIVTAGNDTTRTMLSSGLLALLQHPEQLLLLREAPALIPSALEEILRWANPLHYFRRTATADTMVGRQRIAAGDKLALMYTSANRDEAVFARPHSLRHHPEPEPAPVVRDRRALLSRGAPRPPRRARVPRGAARHVPHDRADGRAAPPALQPQQRAEVAPRPPRRLTGDDAPTPSFWRRRPGLYPGERRQNGSEVGVRGCRWRARGRRGRRSGPWLRRPARAGGRSATGPRRAGTA